MGRLLPHVEAKIVDVRDPGRTVPIGEKGELAVCGYLVMKEYYDDPEKTKEVLIPDEDGKVWMHVRLRINLNMFPLYLLQFLSPLKTIYPDTSIQLIESTIVPSPPLQH